MLTMGSLPQQTIVARGHGIKTQAQALANHWAEKIDNEIVSERVPLRFLGVHPCNRQGVYTQGRACKALFEKIGRQGFSKEDACTPVWAVRQAPSHVTAIAAGKGVPETFHEFNLRKSGEDELPAGTYDRNGTCTHALLGHCHLLNTTRAVDAGAKWEVSFPTEMGFHPCDE